MRDTVVTGTPERAVTSLGSAAMMVAKPDEDLKAVLPAPPVAQRLFAQSDELAVFAEVYDNSGSAPHKVNITASVMARSASTRRASR